MPILTKPVSFTLGASNVFTLNKATLLLHSKVSASSIFSNSGNWNSISVNYKSSLSNQVSVLRFDANNLLTDYIGKIAPTSGFVGNLEVISIVLHDFNGGFLPIYRSELTANEFDIALAAPPNEGGLDFDLLYGGMAVNGSDEVYRASMVGWDNVAYSSAPITGDFSFSGTVNLNGANVDNLFVGYKKSPLPVAPTGGYNTNISSALFFQTNGTVKLLIATNDNTALDVGNQGQSYNTTNRNFLITRVGSVINGSVDGVPVFTDNYSGSLYFAIEAYDTNSLITVSTDLA